MKRDLLDCSEVSEDKSKTIQTIVDKYEKELRVGARVQQEQIKLMKNLDKKYQDMKKTLSGQILKNMVNFIFIIIYSNKKHIIFILLLYLYI